MLTRSTAARAPNTSAAASCAPSQATPSSARKPVPGGSSSSMGSSPRSPNRPRVAMPMKALGGASRRAKLRSRVSAWPTRLSSRIWRRAVVHGRVASGAPARLTTASKPSRRRTAMTPRAASTCSSSVPAAGWRVSTITSSPRARSAATRARPSMPVPPVTATFTQRPPRHPLPSPGYGPGGARSRHAVRRRRAPAARPSAPSPLPPRPPSRRGPSAGRARGRPPTRPGR